MQSCYTWVLYCTCSTYAVRWNPIMFKYMRILQNICVNESRWCDQTCVIFIHCLCTKTKTKAQKLRFELNLCCHVLCYCFKMATKCKHCRKSVETMLNFASTRIHFPLRKRDPTKGVQVSSGQWITGPHLAESVDGHGSTVSPLVPHVEMHLHRDVFLFVLSKTGYK